MVLVCVTAQDACDRLIVAGSRLAALEQLELKVITVRPRHETQGFGDAGTEYLFTLTKQLGAEMIILFHDYAPEAVANYIRSNETHYVIVGLPADPEQSVFIHELENEFPDLPVISVDETGSLQKVWIDADT
jgi:K+-sensing histidine kinase KdpD